MLGNLFLAIALQVHSPQPLTHRVAQICSVHIVGFKFIGVDGQKFELGSEIYTIGTSGFLELISDGETTYRYRGKILPLTVWPMDAFGFTQVPLPQPNEQPVGRSAPNGN